MDNDVILTVENVSKKYCKSLRNVMVYGSIDIARDFLGIPTDSSKLRANEFWALDGVSFELKRGESIGLVGPNGSGKSTLLKAINGIFMPDKGRVSIKGRVGALIEVGAGFHPLLTGRENIYVNGAILGMKKHEIDKKFDDIVDFSGISEFIDQPVKHYSSGMHVRLGFAVAVHCVPDILLVDEVLAVGDYSFQGRCHEKIKELKREGVSIVFVSHNEFAVKSVCNKGVLLDHGKQVYSGEVGTSLDKYYELINEQTKQELTSKGDESPKQTAYRRGNGKVRFTEVKFLDVDGTTVDRVPFGTEKIRVCAKYYAKEKVENPRVSLYLRDANKSDYILVAGMSTFNVYPIDYVEGEGEFEFLIDISCLGPNLYGLYMGIADTVMMEIVYDIWDINRVFLEITESEMIPENDLRISKPYAINTFDFWHRRQ